MNRVNIITLGVKDVTKSCNFYRNGLGFETPNREENLSIVFFNNGGSKLALYPILELAKDINEDNPPQKNNNFTGFSLAYNAKSKQEVDAIFEKIEQIGGTIVKPPQNVFWGGYSGYFQDLDGYYWEVAYADSWAFDSNDMLIITGE